MDTKDEETKPGYNVDPFWVDDAIYWALHEVERSNEARDAFYDGQNDGRALADTLTTVDDIDKRIENAHRTMVLHRDMCSRVRAYGRKLGLESSLLWTKGSPAAARDAARKMARDTARAIAAKRGEALGRRAGGA